jgi:hypothetical protein
MLALRWTRGVFRSKSFDQSRLLFKAREMGRSIGGGLMKKDKRDGVRADLARGEGGHD